MNIQSYLLFEITLRRSYWLRISAMISSLKHMFFISIPKISLSFKTLKVYSGVLILLYSSLSILQVSSINYSNSQANKASIFIIIPFLVNLLLRWILYLTHGLYWWVDHEIHFILWRHINFWCESNYFLHYIPKYMLLTLYKYIDWLFVYPKLS